MKVYNANEIGLESETTMDNYIHSFIKKFDYYFEQKEISNIIYLHDQDDHERLDQVLFLEKEDGHVIGLYI
ncbi:hypothetical protein HNR77_003882 [Paenibacillus sp. JGP012]|nr:hypothetical protein [Paenibacillus sp. JGP012]